MSRRIEVYADWSGEEPVLIGTLVADQARGKEHFSFAYARDWLVREDTLYLRIDPDLLLFQGTQHTQDDRNFRTFLDSCPDRWGRLLMQRREAVLARQQNRRARTLLDSDYLLGVYDECRMGAMRYKTEADGAFLNNDHRLAAPPMTSLRELEQAARNIETHNDPDDPEYIKWLFMLISPGSSLGGARPKVSVTDEQGDLWIAKFPSRYDDHDVGAWEYLTYQLAIKAGIDMRLWKFYRASSGHPLTTMHRLSDFAKPS